MKFTAGALAVALLALHIWFTHVGATVIAYDGEMFVRGYLGYVVATVPPFLAGALTLWGLLH